MKQDNSKIEAQSKESQIIKEFFGMYDKPGNQMLMNILENDNF